MDQARGRETPFRAAPPQQEGGELEHDLGRGECRGFGYGGPGDMEVAADATQSVHWLGDGSEAHGTLAGR